MKQETRIPEHSTEGKSFKVSELKDHNPIEIRVGATCWKCKAGKFEYDGMLNLVCTNCGYTSGGCFT